MNSDLLFRASEILNISESKQPTMKTIIYQLLLITAFFGKSIYLQATEVEFKVPYNAFLMLGSSTTGKSSLTNLLLNHLKHELEHTEEAENQTLLAPAYKSERILSSTEMSESFDSKKFFRVRLGQTERHNPNLSLSATQSFESYLYPQAHTVILDTPGSYLANTRGFRDSLAKSITSLNTGLNIRLSQGLIFMTLSIADINAISENNLEGLSAKFRQQKNSLVEILNEIPNHLKERFTIIFCPEYNNPSQNPLQEMQNAISGMNPLRRIIGNFIGEQLGLRILASQVFVLDLGDELEAMKNPNEIRQNLMNHRVYKDLLASLKHYSKEAVSWTLSEEDGDEAQTMQRGLRAIQNFFAEMRNPNANRTPTEISILQRLAQELNAKKNLSNNGLDRFRDYHREASASLNNAREVLLDVRRTRVEVKKLGMDGDKVEPRTIKIAYPDEFEFSRYTPEYFTFGLSADKKFTVQKIENNNKFPISGIDSVPVPQVRQDLLDEQGSLSLFLTEFSYQDFPTITLELDHEGSAQNVNSLTSTFAAEGLSFHQRGRLMSIFNRGQETSINLLSEKLLDEDRIELNIPDQNQDRRHQKFQSLVQCENHLENCNAIEVTCRENIDCLRTLQQDINTRTFRCINGYRAGEASVKAACYTLDYVSKYREMPLTPRIEYDIVQNHTSDFQAASRDLAQTKQAYDEEARFFPKFPDSKVIDGDNEISYLKSLLDEPQLSILKGLKSAFEKREIVSYEQDGNIRYISKNPGLLLAVYNLSLIPKYHAPKSNMEQVRKYLDFDSEEHLEAAFSLSDDRDDIKNRIPANKKLNILLFGPKGSGKSTLTNVLNHYASTIDVNRKKSILENEKPRPGPGEYIGYLWNEDGVLNNTWVDFYYPQDMRSKVLRSIIPNRKPENREGFEGFGYTGDESNLDVPAYQANGFKFHVNEDKELEGTSEQGNIVNSLNSQMPYITPEYQLSILDSSGLLHRTTQSGSKSHKIIKILENFEGEGIDGLCLVLDLSRWWRSDLRQFYISPRKGAQDYLKGIKKQLDDVLIVQKYTNLPLNIVLTHSSEFFDSYGDEALNVEEVKKSLSRFLSELLGELKLGVDTHVYAFEFANLWRRNEVWPIHFKANMYEAGRLLEGITKQSQSSRIDTFKTKLKDQVNSHRTHFRIKWGNNIRSLEGFDIESSPNHDFNDDVKSISNEKIQEQIQKKLEEDATKLVELPLEFGKEDLPYLVGIAIKDKHPDTEARIELFPLHHAYDLGADADEPQNSFPWATKQGWKAFDKLQRLTSEEFKINYAQYQAQRLVRFLNESIKNGEKALIVGRGKIQHLNFVATRRVWTGLFRNTPKIIKIWSYGCLLGYISKTLRDPNWMNKNMGSSNLIFDEGLPEVLKRNINHEELAQERVWSVNVQNFATTKHIFIPYTELDELSKNDGCQYDKKLDGFKNILLSANSDGTYSLLTEFNEVMEVKKIHSQIALRWSSPTKKDINPYRFYLDRIPDQADLYRFRSSNDNKYLANVESGLLELHDKSQNELGSSSIWRLRELNPYVLVLEKNQDGSYQLSAPKDKRFNIEHDEKS